MIMTRWVRDLWTKALRRKGKDKYKQGKGALRTNNTYCCLGVLCDLWMEHTEEGKKSKWEEVQGSRSRFKIMKSEMFLPLEVQKWAGLTDTGGTGGNLEIKGELGSLAGHNDRGVSFLRIANVIQDKL